MDSGESVEAIRIRRSDRAFFVGTTGSGKTTLARLLLAQLPDVVVLDPKHGFSWGRTKVIPGGITTSDRRVLAAWKGPAPIIYRPSLDECASGLSWFWLWVWERGNTIVYVDEVMMITKPVNIPRGLATCIQMGRQKNIGVWTATQRPSRIPIPIISESEHCFVFRLRHPDDQKRMAQYSDMAILNDPALGHDFWYYGDRTQTLFKKSAKQLKIGQEANRGVS